MKAVMSKGENKKRKRDVKEPVAESHKKAKVHAQRKFAQGAAFNSSAMTPIKDKVRPSAASSSSGPMLTRTSILPPKLDFFKDALGSEQDSISNINHRASFERGGSSGASKKQNIKKSFINDEGNKCQPGAVQALRRKYQEQRLAKQKVSNVTKLAQKVKGKNMVRTRSSTVSEETKPVPKKQIHGSENKIISTSLRSGLKRIRSSAAKPDKSVTTPKNLRMGLRSRRPNLKTDNENYSQIKSSSVAVKKIEPKKCPSEIPQVKTKNESKLKKAEGFSDFSSDDNEPLLAVKMPKVSAKKSAKILTETTPKKAAEKKSFVKTRSQASETSQSKISVRPTRKTKEAAAIYMEMITKKLVSPDKSGDEDVSSVDSFPELPNSKRNEQQETEIRAKGLANRKGEQRQRVEEKARESKRSVSKKAEATKSDNTKEEIKSVKKVSKNELKTNAKQDENSGNGEKASKISIREKQTSIEDGKKEETVPNFRPSTRSRHQDESETPPNKNHTKLSSAKTSKITQNDETPSRVEKFGRQNKKGKSKIEPEEEKSGRGSDGVAERSDKSKTETQKGSGSKEGMEGNVRKGKKLVAGGKGEGKETEMKNATTNPKKSDKKESKMDLTSGENKRPTRKCTAADKICFEIDAFTSDEDEFFNTVKTIKPKIPTKKMDKKEGRKKASKTESAVGGKSKNDGEPSREESLSNGEPKKNEKESKKEKTEDETKPKEVSDNNKPTEIEVESVDLDGKLGKSEEGERNEKGANEKNESSQSATKPEKVAAFDNERNEKIDAWQSESVGSKCDSDTKTVAEETVNEIGQRAEEKSHSVTAYAIENETEKRKCCPARRGKKSKEDEKDTDSAGEDVKKTRGKVSGKEMKRKSLRDKVSVSEERPEMSEKPTKRTRPVRKCSTGEKKWIETDSDFSFCETSDDDDLPIFDFGSENEEKSSPDGTDTKDNNKKPEEIKVEDDVADVGDKKRDEKPRSDNFSESDEEPLQKRARIEGYRQTEMSKMAEAKTPVKTQREVPDLHPLKKVHNEVQPLPAGGSPPISKISPETERPIFNVPVAKEPTGKVFCDGKSLVGNWQVPTIPTTPCRLPDSKQESNPRNRIPPEDGGNVSVETSGIGKVIQPPVKDGKDPEGCSRILPNDVKVAFGNAVPYRPIIPDASHFVPTPCNYQAKPPVVSFPTLTEPISTHGLDLLSEVAIPTAPAEKFNSQTERIEKWLKDSLAAEQKKTFQGHEEAEYKATVDRERNRKITPEKKSESYFGKSTMSPASSHREANKFGHVDLAASQKLLKRNVFPASGNVGKVDRQSTPPKKVLTTVQDLLKLQKERREVAKSPVDNSPHPKNCKCNNCIVKKGWFKNKPVPKAEQQKSCAAEECEASAKPFQSLTKAFPKVSAAEGKSSKMSVSVVSPMVATSSSPSKNAIIAGKELSDRQKGVFQQRKLSFLERMKERERKESAAGKGSPNAFSPNDESSVYAFEPESEAQQVTAPNASFRRKTREAGRTWNANNEDPLKACEEESCPAGIQMEKSPSEGRRSSKGSQSASIAVQVNLDSEAMTEAEVVPETQDGKSMEISTQTEVPEEDSDTPMFYIPLQQATSAGSSGCSDRQLIQGVALKLDTEGPMGPNQRVVMKAKLVTKPPDAPSIKAVVMPQPKRIFDQKSNNPPIGTVQPTARKPPEEPKSTETEAEREPKSPKHVHLSAPTSADSVSAGVSSVESLVASKASRRSSQAKPMTKTREKLKEQIGGKAETVDDCSPSCSSSASSHKSKSKTTKQKTSETATNPGNSSTNWPPAAGSTSNMAEAPTFHATEKDFQDPFEFFDRIRPAAEKFGLCRIVPPSSFKPDCKVSDDMRFTAYNQYVHRMFHRWGPNIKEMMAIKKYLATQSISLKQPPWIGGIEVDLPRLYQTVQNCGGLMKVMEKKKWHQVADMMRIPKAAQDRVTKLDDIYCKYLLPYDTLSPEERQNLFDEVEKDWLERQENSSAESSAEEDSEEDNYIDECEECVVKGRNMALNQFYRIARNTMSMWFKNAEPPPREVENEFWRHVSERNHHVCVHSGSIDSSGWGYGFPVAKNNSFSKHPWNLKVLTNNSRSVLRSLGPAMGVTVPTLHVGMVFAAFCWYRDPHGLPWIEYLHTGAPKIWYGIPDDSSAAFQDALGRLLPRYTKKKTIWLASDTAMIPPALLVDHGVSLCHTIQEPGQFILVFPRAYISSICTGYLVSESVYFAQSSWLATAEKAFEDIQESCEPSMFSLEKLLFSIATDSRSSVDVLKQVLPMVWHVRQKEIDGRKTLFNLGLKTSERLPSRESGSKKRKGRWVQDDEGDYECEICRRNLFVSLVTNSHEEGTYCLQHAIELLTQKRHQLKFSKLMYSYTQEEMNELVEKLEQRIETKSQKKPPGKIVATSK